MYKYKLMIVDDSCIIRNRIERCFSQGQFEIVAQAGDGVDAIKKYKRFKPDIITMDLTMPHMDGLACIKELCALDPEVDILVVSALSDRATALDSLEYGARGFICKPFTDEQLIKALNMVLHSDDLAEP